MGRNKLDPRTALRYSDRDVIKQGWGYILWKEGSRAFVSISRATRY